MICLRVRWMIVLTTVFGCATPTVNSRCPTAYSLGESTVTCSVGGKVRYSGTAHYLITSLGDGWYLYIGPGYRRLVGECLVTTPVGAKMGEILNEESDQ